MLAHELSHVAHRDVLVMTVASSAGIIAGMVTRGAQFGGCSADRATTTRAGRSAFVVVLVVSLVVYAISFLLLRLLSRYRELCADRSGAYLTQKPSALASALTKISGQMNAVPERDLRATPKPMNAFFITPAVRGLGDGHADGDPPAARAATRPAREDRRQPRPDPAESGCCTWASGTRCAVSPDHAPANLDALFSLPSAALTLEVSLGLHPTGSGSVCFRAAEGYAAAATQDEAVRPGRHGRRTEHREPGRRVRLHLADRPCRPGGHRRAGDRPARGELRAGGAGLRHRTALLDGRLPRRQRSAGVPRLPLQAGHLLPVLPDGSEQPRHLAGAPDPRRRGGRPARRGGHLALDADLGDQRERDWVSRGATCRAGPASAAARPWPSARSPGRPRSR